MSESPDYMRAFRGSFTSALRWHDLDALWQVVQDDATGGWYIYAVGEPPPAQTSEPPQLLAFIDEVDKLLRVEHDEAYCGIVYADDLQHPSFVKIYDPNNLGVSCGYSNNPPLPGWVLSKIPPVDLPATWVPKNRKRWWRSLFGG